jgi:hypothetical protein
MKTEYEKLCKTLGIFKTRVSEEESDRLKKAIEFLEWNIDSGETQSFARSVGILAGVCSVTLIFLLSFALSFSVLWLIFALFPVLLYFYLKKYPILKAESEKKKSLGQMPEVVSYLIMSLRINPNIENAIEFSAGHAKGLFRKKLGRIIIGIQTGSESAEAGLTKLANEFSKWDEFRRCIRLVIASTLERTEERRQETLDKATDVLLGGFAARTEKEARALNTPVMIVFTFGVILPLIFVAIIPFMSLMGIAIGAPAIAIMYAVALPLFLYIMIKFIASSRPITMNPPEVPKEKKVGRAVLVSSAVGLLLAMLVFLGKDVLGAMEYLPVLWGVGAGVGLFMLMTSIGPRRTRKEIKNLEGDFGETLHGLGIILSEGRPLEDAMASMDSEFMNKAATNIATFNTDLRSAFFDEDYGSLKGVYSQTIRGIVDILISISNKGSETMAQISFRMSEHLSNLRKSEQEIERALGGVVSSMKIIAIVVAPLVGGMISSMSVVLADTMVESQAASVGFGESLEAIDPSLITLIIGIYAMESAAILVMFGSDLMNGDDPVMKRFGIGIALPIAIAVFTVCAWLANSLFGGIA